MFSGDHVNEYDDSGRIKIDKDPNLFRMVLEYIDNDMKVEPMTKT